MFTSLLGLLIAPLYALSYFGTADGAESLAAPHVALWAVPAGALLQPLLSFGSADQAYIFFGRLFIIVLVGLLLGMAAAQSRQAHVAGRLARWGFGTMFTGTVLMLTGTAGIFLIEPSDLFFFGFDIPGLLLFMVGTALFGLGSLRANLLPRRPLWLLIAGAFPGMIVLTILLGQLMLAFILIHIAWLMNGRWLAVTAPAEMAALHQPA